MDRCVVAAQQCVAAELRHPCRKRLPSVFNAGFGCIIVWLVNVFRFDQGRRRPHDPLGDQLIVFVIRLEIIDYPPDRSPYTTRNNPDPKWSDIEAAIRALDKHRFPFHKEFHRLPLVHRQPTRRRNRVAAIPLGHTR